jgi:tetrahydromethanopterin S-methyltransferase subunit B
MAEEQDLNEGTSALAHGLIETMAEVAENHIEVALRPLLARIAALERQVAELRGDLAPSETLEGEYGDLT